VSDGSAPRVVIVDDHDLFRAGVRASLGQEVEVVADSGDVEGAVQAIEELEPDVVLLDVHMPGGGGAEVIRRVGESHPAVRFLALSVSDTAEDVIALIRAGARGYVTKTISGPDLRAMPFSHPAWPASYSTPSPVRSRPHRWTRSWTC
jgi:DNA-binding NarL/FixJ family response regulator